MSKLILDKIYNEMDLVDYIPLKANFKNVIFDYGNDFLAEHELSNYPLVILTLSKGIPAFS